jgi:hypothetical protein
MPAIGVSREVVTAVYSKSSQTLASTSCLEMVLKPLRQLFSCDEAGGEVKHQAFLFIDGRHDLRAIQHEERLHRRVGSAFVAVENG